MASSATAVLHQLTPAGLDEHWAERQARLAPPGLDEHGVQLRAWLAGPPTALPR